MRTTRKSWEELSKKAKLHTMAAMGALYGNADPEIDAIKPPKKRKKKTYPEHAIQCEVVSWYRKWRLLGHSIPNGGRRSVIQGNRERMAGLTAGVSDLFFAEPRKGHHGLYLELKAPGKKPTQEQLAWLDAVKAKGYAGEWFDSSEKAIEFLESYMGFSLC